MGHDSTSDRGFRAFLKTRRFLMVNAALSLFLVWAFVGEVRVNHDLAEEATLKEREAASLEEENHSMTEETERLASADAAEREARLKLNLKLPGEEVVILRGFAEAGEDPVRAAVRSGDTPAPSGVVANAAGWWHYFFK
jgi:cell division protein FtsB